MPKPIVVVGSINLDLVASVARLPSPGETIFGDAFYTFFGGKGANQAVAAAKLGYPVVMLGKVGSDGFGSQLVGGLRTAGVDVSRIQKVDGASGVAVILTDRSGENSIVVVPEANGSFSPSDLESHRDVLSGAGIILTQLEIPLDTINYLAKAAKDYDIPLVLDPAPAQSLPSALLKNLSWITPNEIEARSCIQTNELTLTDEEIAESLLAAGVRNVILKLGARGALVAARDTPMTLVPGYVVKAVDTTAAGDAFNGAFAVATMRGMKPAEAVLYANAVSAIAVTRRGAQPSMPSNEEVELFLEREGPNHSAGTNQKSSSSPSD